MATRFFLRDTQTEPGTGGAVYDLLAAQGASATLGSGNEGGTTFVEKQRFQRTVDDQVSGSSFPISINMASVSASTLEWRYRVQQLDSANAIKASSAYDGPYNTAGIKTATLTLSGTWVTGDRLAVSLELRKVSGGGNRSFTLNVNDAASYTDATMAGASVTLAGVPAGVATVSVAMAISRPLAGTSAAVASVTAAVAVTRGLAGSAAGIATVTAALTVTAGTTNLAGAPAGAAAVSGGLSVTRGLAAAPAGVAAVSGALTLSLRLAAAPAGIATVTAALAVVTTTWQDYGSLMLIDVAKYGGTVTFFFEATLRTSAGGTARARLYDIAGAAAVAGSTVSTPSTTLVRQRSGALTLSGSKEYKAQQGATTGATATIRGARVVVEQA